MRVAIFTTALDAFDGPHTRPIGHAGFTADGEPVRVVSVALDVAIDQVEKYLASGARAWNAREWRSELAAGGHADISFVAVDIALFGDSADASI